LTALSNQSFLAALENPVLQNVMDGLLLVLDTEGRIISFNRACETTTGYQQQEVIGRHFEFLIPVDQRKSVKAVFTSLKAGDFPNQHVNEWIDKAGQIHSIQWANSALTNKLGEVEFIVATGIEMTAYVKIVQEMIESRDRFRDLVETTSDWVWEIDANGIYTYASPKVMEILGYAPNEIVGKSPFDLMPEAEAARVREIFLRIAAKAQPINSLLNINLHKNGHEVVLETSGVPVFSNDGQLLGYRGMDRDVSQRQQTENALRESETRLRLSQQFANIGSWEWHISTGALFWSDQVWPLFGYSDRTLKPTYENFLSSVHQDDVEKVVDAINACLEQGAKYEVEHRIICPDGRIHWVRELGNVIRDEAGQAVRMFGVILDINERKEAELRLRESEQRFRALLDNAVDAILLLNMKGLIQDGNQRAADLFGMSHSDLSGNLLPEMFADKSLMLSSVERLQVLENDQSITYETTIRRQDGVEIPVEISKCMIPVGGENIIQAIVRDITQRKLREAAQIEQAKIQRDSLVREVHHRIKNNLQGIVGLLRSELNDSNNNLEQAMETAIQQVSSIALVHGLQCQHSQGELLLCELVPAIAKAAESYGSHMAKVTIASDIRNSLEVLEEEAVPLALIINELVTNAVKYADTKSGNCIIRLQLQAEHGRGELKINTPGGVLPHGFDFQSGNKCGTGLELVHALLPKKGVKIEYQQMPDRVITRVIFSEPVVRPGTSQQALKNQSL